MEAESMQGQTTNRRALIERRRHPRVHPVTELDLHGGSSSYPG